MSINIGLDENQRKEIANGLSHLLADTYTLYLKTHNYHWNVVGGQFQMLHALFENEYNDLALAVDEIAERIRALDFPAPGSYSAFSKLASIQEETGQPDASAMIKNLVSDQEALVKTCRGVLKVAEPADDQVSIDLVTTRMKTHEKAAWMLRSLLA